MERMGEKRMGGMGDGEDRRIGTMGWMDRMGGWEDGGMRMIGRMVWSWSRWEVWGNQG